MYRIRFIGAYGTLYLGNGWGPEASKARAVKFQTRESAEARLSSVREIMANPANAGLWLAAHIADAEIVS